MLFNGGVMSARISSSTGHVRRTANLPTATNFTICGRSRVVNDNNGTWRYIAGLENTTYPTDSTAENLLGWDNATNTFHLAVSGSRTNFATTPTAATGWFFWAITCSGTGAGSLNGYWVADQGSYFAKASMAGTSFTPASMIIHSDTFDEWVDGNIESVIVYDRVLSEPELWAQRHQIFPVSLDQINCWAYFQTFPDLGDWSGKGRAWTAGTTLTTGEASQTPFTKRQLASRRLNSASSVISDGSAFADGQVYRAVNDGRRPNMVAF